MNASRHNVTGSAAPAGNSLFRGDTPPLLLLVLFRLWWWLPGFYSLPPVDRDEARMAQTSRQILEEHQWWQLRFQQDPRMKKPPGGYWLQAAATALLASEAADGIWSYRIPSLLSGVAGVAMWQAWRHRRQPAVRVCLAWLLPGWLFLELMPTKLPHYLLPLYPAAALLAGWMLTAPEPVRAEAWQARWVSIGRGCWMLAPLLLSLALPSMAGYLGDPID